MPRIITNVQTAPVPGFWQRLAALQADSDAGDGLDLVRQLETMNIPRDQRAVVHAVRSWDALELSPIVAFAIWLLRDRQEDDGSFKRRPHSAMAETAPTLRYVQVVLMAGEDLVTDEAACRAVRWIEMQQLPDGGLRDFPNAHEAELGTTARVLRAFSAHQVPMGGLEDLRHALVDTAIDVGADCAWSTQRSDPTPVTGATALATSALVAGGYDGDLVERAARWLLAAQNRDGGWLEVPTSGNLPSAASNTFNVVRALRDADGHLGGSADVAAALEQAREWWLREFAPSWQRRPLAEQVFGLRLAPLLSLQEHDESRRLAARLVEHACRKWSAACDLYIDVELLAIALLEWSWCAPPSATEPLDELPRVPPAFLRQEPHVYDLLYTVARTRRSMAFVDALARVGLAESMLGGLVGSLATLAALDERVLVPLADPSSTVRWGAGAVAVGAGWSIWALVRVAMRGPGSRAVVGLLVALAASGLLTAWTFSHYADWNVAGFGLVWAVHFLAVDVVAASADQAGLVRRLLPDG